MLLELKIKDFIPFIIFLFSLKGKFPFWYLVPLGFLGISVISVIVNWYYKVYWIENNVLHIKQGLFVKKESYLNKERVQTINTSSSMLYQILGLTKLKIETAGGGNEPEVNLAGLRADEAKTLIAMLNEPAEGPIEIEETVSGIHAEEEKQTEYKLNWKEILLASVTSGQFGLLFSLLFFLYSQVDNYIPTWIKDEAEAYVKGHDVYGLIYLVVVLLIVSWIVSTLGYALKYANFTVHRKNDEIRISQGLLERKELVLKLHRIQGITIKEGIFRQPFGYCSVHVEVIQNNEEGEKNVTLHPVIRKDRVAELLAHLQLPYELTPHVTALPKTALRRYLLDSFIFFCILAVPITGASIYFEKYFVIWALLPLFGLLMSLGYASFRAGGYRVEGEQLTIVYRSLAKYTGLVRRRHVQSIEKTQSYFQRGAQLCSPNFFSASTNYKLEHMRLEDAERMRDWYKNK